MQPNKHIISSQMADVDLLSAGVIDRKRRTDLKQFPMMLFSVNNYFKTRLVQLQEVHYSPISVQTPYKIILSLTAHL